MRERAVQHPDSQGYLSRSLARRVRNLLSLSRPSSLLAAKSKKECQKKCDQKNVPLSLAVLQPSLLAASGKKQRQKFAILEPNRQPGTGLIIKLFLLPEARALLHAFQHPDTTTLIFSSSSSCLLSSLELSDTTMYEPRIRALLACSHL